MVNSKNSLECISKKFIHRLLNFMLFAPIRTPGNIAIAKWNVAKNQGTKDKLYKLGKTYFSNNGYSNISIEFSRIPR